MRYETTTVCPVTGGPHFHVPNIVLAYQARPRGVYCDNCDLELFVDGAKWASGQVIIEEEECIEDVIA